MAVLGFAVFTGALLVRSDVDAILSRKELLAAEREADKGIALAANPLVEPWDPILQRRDAETGEGYEARVLSEGARFNLNTLLLREDRVVLKRLFAKWGLDPAEGDALLGALLDWVDADSQERLNGAEAGTYAGRGQPGLPFNRPFQSLDEVVLVAGMEQVEARVPDWRNYFTVWSSGKLDVNEAEADLIAMACGCSVEAAASLVKYRRGADGRENTRDDIPVRSLEELALELSLGGESGLEPGVPLRVSFVEPVERIESTGRAGNAVLRRTVILRRDGGRLVVFRVMDERGNLF